MLMLYLVLTVVVEGKDGPTSGVLDPLSLYSVWCEGVTTLEGGFPWGGAIVGGKGAPLAGGLWDRKRRGSSLLLEGASSQYEGGVGAKEIVALIGLLEVVCTEMILAV